MRNRIGMLLIGGLIWMAIGSFFAKPSPCVSLHADEPAKPNVKPSTPRPVGTAARASLAADESASWPQFLGPNRNGVSSEKGLVDKWPSDGLPIVWRTQGGVGMSAVAVARGRALTMVQRGGRQTLVSLDALSGKPIWERPIAPEYENSMGNGPRATPTIAGDRIFVFTGEGVLAAVNREDGELLWSHDVPKELGGRPADYGMACSPLVVGKLVIVTPGAPNATVAAYQADSGELAWKAGDDPAGYSSPSLLDVGGRKQVVVFSGASVLGVDPADGQILWRHEYVTDYDCNIATPLAIDGDVFVSCGENHGAARLRLREAGGKYEVTEVWTSFGTKSVLRNEWQTSILLGGRLFGFDNVGSAGPVTHFTCVDAASGERVWQQLRFGKGNLIAADGKLFVSTMNGELVVLQASASGFEELGRQEVLGSTRQAPSLAGGLLYLRDDEHIVCLDARRK